jgi:predicted aspartyl protease
MANGQHITRDVGIVIVRSGEFKTVAEVVFGLPGNLVLLGVRTLEGFNAIVDPRRRCLVAAGPMPAAAA